MEQDHTHSHCEGIQEVVESEIHLSTLAHRPTDSTEHVSNYPSSVYGMEISLIIYLCQKNQF